MSKKISSKPDIPQIECTEIFIALVSTFLKNQPYASRAYVFNDKLYICKYDEAASELRVTSLDQSLMYDFLKDFATYVFEFLVDPKSTLLLSTKDGEAKYKLKLLSNKTLKIRKVMQGNI